MLQQDKKGKGKKFVRLMLRTIDEQNVRLRNSLDVDLKITLLQIFQSHQKIIKNVLDFAVFNYLLVALEILQ